MTQFPIRHKNHILEEKSQNFFSNCIPSSWAWQKVSPDYGVDLRVEIFESNQAQGKELLVQLKSSGIFEESNGSIPVELKLSTYNYIWNKLEVGMLVKYFEDTDEAYYILFKDIPSPNKSQQTFTVRIPTTNILSECNWPQIVSHIKNITNAKLDSVRR